uniref:Uncharacterized protein n=1 Tax=Meloidogyne incognita TaxID=6306 RepID=A0A914KL26_MELIC
MDEAQLQLAEEADYSKDFEEDLRGNVEHGDIYDEHLAQLPEFEVHKLGKNLGWTQLPIVTRRKALWSTPLPRTRPFSHSWAWLYTKPPTAATQRQKQTTTISPEVNNKIEKSVINDKNVERKDERREKISEETIKTTTPRKMQNETNLNAKSLETTKRTVNKEREQQINKTKTEKDKTQETTQTTTQTTTTTFSTNKATTINREEQKQTNIKTTQLEKEKTKETTKTTTRATTITTFSLNKTPTKTTQTEKEKTEETTKTTTTTTFSPNKLVIEKEEKEHLIERLRKLLKNANLKGVFPSENNKVVVEVRSNVIAIEPAVDSKNTDPSKTGSGFAWPRSWDNNEADDRLAIRSWASQFYALSNEITSVLIGSFFEKLCMFELIWFFCREHSRQPDHQLVLPFQNNSDEGEELISTPKQLPNILQSSIQVTTTTKIPTTIKTTTKVPTTARKKGVVKPTFFNAGTHRHSGPTFNCRVLDAAVDGIPSENNDQTCPLDFPGIASDKSCKCTYEVSGRDEEGCATGFIYTCLRTVKSSNNDLKS